MWVCVCLTWLDSRWLIMIRLLVDWISRTRFMVEEQMVVKWSQLIRLFTVSNVHPARRHWPVTQLQTALPCQRPYNILIDCDVLVFFLVFLFLQNLCTVLVDQLTYSENSFGDAIVASCLIRLFYFRLKSVQFCKCTYSYCTQYLYM